MLYSKKHLCGTDSDDKLLNQGYERLDYADESTALIITKESSITISSNNEFSPENIGILLSYFIIGIVSKLNQTPVQYYLIEFLNCSSSQFSAYSTLHRLPWSLKFIWGMCSDRIPIFGYRRKSWLLIGWIGYCAVNFTIYLLKTPSINMMVFLVFLFTTFLVICDVATDTLSVERTRFENDSSKGNFQTTGYIIRAIGRIIGSFLGTYLYENGRVWSFSLSQIFLLGCMIPIVTVSFSFWSLKEYQSYFISGVTISDQLTRFWSLLQMHAAWKPILFMYCFNLLQISNPAWSNFLVIGLNFSDESLGYLLVFSSIISLVGFIFYRLFLNKSSFRFVFIFTASIGILFTYFQMALAKQWNTILNIPNELLALGDEGTYALSDSLNSMPFVIMFLLICPEGAEGSIFSLLTTMYSLSLMLSFNIGTSLTGVWDVSNTALEEGDFSGIFYLAIITGILRLLPIMLLGLIPKTKAQYQTWIGESRVNWVGGFVVTIVTISAFLYTLLLNLKVLLL